MKMKKRVIVACVNANGEADVFPCVVECSEEQFMVGDHYEAAEKLAESKGYDEPMVAADSKEPLFHALTRASYWNDAPLIEVV